MVGSIWKCHVPNNYFWICLVSISNFRLCVCVHIYLYLYSIGIAYKMVFVDFSFKRRYPQPHHGRGLHVWDRAVTIYMPRLAMTFDNWVSLDLYGRTGDLLSWWPSQLTSFWTRICLWFLHVLLVFVQCEIMKTLKSYNKKTSCDTPFPVIWRCL